MDREYSHVRITCAIVTHSMLNSDNTAQHHFEVAHVCVVGVGVRPRAHHMTSLSTALFTCPTSVSSASIADPELPPPVCDRHILRTPGERGAGWLRPGLGGTVPFSFVWLAHPYSGQYVNTLLQQVW